MAIRHDDTTDGVHTARPNEPIPSLIPARLDRLGWSRFHTMLVVALGVAWVLDGLEITIASNVTALISKPQALNLSSGDASFAIGTVYLLGEVAGALFFGRMSDKWGRRNLFMITLGVYLFGGLLTALTFGHSQGCVYWLWASRFIAGMGIGGEYAAINSAIDELIPAKYRGQVDIAVNRTYWGGAFLGTIVTLLVVNNLSGCRLSSDRWKTSPAHSPPSRRARPRRDPQQHHQPLSRRSQAFDVGIPGRAASSQPTLRDEPRRNSVSVQAGL